MGLTLVAGAWGFAEALLFFLVPDILLSALALRDRRKALLAGLAAAIGATFGGALMYWWGASSFDAVLSVLERLPGIGPGMIEGVGGELQAHGVFAMVLGPLSGTPYKVYAAEAAATGVPMWLFVAITPFARLPRFLIVTFVTALAARILQNWGAARLAYPLWFVAWAGFYAVYFAIME